MQTYIFSDFSHDFSVVNAIYVYPGNSGLIPQKENIPPAPCTLQPETYSSDLHILNTNDQQLTTILQIDIHRPDRIIFLRKEVKLTPTGFSLLYLLAQHREKVVSYEDILKDLWKGEEDAIYTRINYHMCKIRKDISKIMDKKEDSIKKIENIFKAIPGRGLMLDIKERELKLI